MVKPWIKKINTKNWNIVWTIRLEGLTPQEIENSEKFKGINLEEKWFEKINLKKTYVKDLTTHINYSPNFIRIKIMDLLTNDLIKIPIVTFKEY